MLWMPFMSRSGIGNNFMSLASRRSYKQAGCNHKYPRRPSQGEQEKARRRRQIARGMLNAENRNL